MKAAYTAAGVVSVLLLIRLRSSGNDGDKADIVLQGRAHVQALRESFQAQRQDAVSPFASFTRDSIYTELTKRPSLATFYAHPGAADGLLNPGIRTRDLYTLFQTAREGTALSPPISTLRANHCCCEPAMKPPSIFESARYPPLAYPACG